MRRDRGEDLALVGAVREAFADASDLFRKEMRLAKAELTHAISSGLRAGVWMAVAGVLGLVAALLLIQAIVFALASLGLGFGWASFVVALALTAVAAGAFFYGRSLARGARKPERTLRQVNRDITAAREQFT